MTGGNPDGGPNNEDEEISLLALASILIRWRMLIVMLGLGGAIIGLVLGLRTTRLYVATATFLPQSTESSSSGLALAASQLGIRVPTSGATWGPPMYVELLRSRVLLEPIVLDTVVVAEENGRRLAVLDLLHVAGPTPARRLESGVTALRGIITSHEEKVLNGVVVSATTQWPSVSLFLTERALSGVNQFNLQTRRSQAAAEREFVDARVKESEAALRHSEDALQSFLQGNRDIGGSPQLAFERERLQRAVSLNQQVYSSLLQNLQDARIREVRDTPVITVFEAPRLPLVPEGRGVARKAVLGGLAGGVIAILIVIVLQALDRLRATPSKDVQEFLYLLRQMTPRFLRRETR